MRLFIVASWSPAGKGLTSWLSFVMSYCQFVTMYFPFGILGQVWNLILSIPDLYPLSYFDIPFYRCEDLVPILYACEDLVPCLHIC